MIVVEPTIHDIVFTKKPEKQEVSPITNYQYRNNKFATVLVFDKDNSSAQSVLMISEETIESGYLQITTHYSDLDQIETLLKHSTKVNLFNEKEIEKIKEGARLLRKDEITALTIQERVDLKYADYGTILLFYSHIGVKHGVLLQSYETQFLFKKRGSDDVKTKNNQTSLQCG